MNKRQRKKQEKMRRKWDPDFTKVTPEEKAQMDAADQELQRGIYFTEKEVWEEQHE